MTTYDFRNLNDKEFEAFSIDLLSQHLGERIERFKPGRDRGVDGRWFAGINKEVVIQCKHWIGTGYNALLKHLETKELPKLLKLRPSRYLLISSVPFSRVNKTRISHALAPFIETESDVLGAEDLNDMLGRHPLVERRHFKLWLYSSQTLAALLNNAIIGRSRAELEDILSEAPLYVTTRDFALARDHLAERRVILLTGEPGIGKTTLARQLILEYAASGFDLVVLEESVSEAEAIFTEDQKQLFYFDDFLGRTFLEALKTKQDSHIVNFMKRIARDPTKRFVLTSRTNILNQGAVLSDLFAEGQVVKNIFELRIGSQTTLDRGRMLYNHVWHSALTSEYREELFAHRRYQAVIQHPNYNPRLVAFVLDNDKISGVLPAQYWKFIAATFKNPREVWGHFFTGQLTQDSRDLVYVTVLSGGRIQEDDLRQSFASLLAKVVDAALAQHRFGVAVRHCTKSVLNRRLRTGGSAEYTLFNPSISDYVLGELAQSSLWEHYYLHLRTPAALSWVEQMRRQEFFGETQYRVVLHAMAVAESTRLRRVDAYSVRLARMLATSDGMGHEFTSLVTAPLLSPITTDFTSKVDDLLTLFVESASLLDEEARVRFARGLPSLVEGQGLSGLDRKLLGNLLSALQELQLDSELAEIRSQIVEDWQESIKDVVDEDGFLAGYLDPDDTSAAEDELQAFVLSVLHDSGIEPKPGEVSAICSQVDVNSIVERNLRVAEKDDEERPESYRYSDSPNQVDAVDDLFDRSNL